MSEEVFREEFKIRANEVDTNGEATLPAICNLLQEVAGNHALQLKFDITDLHKQNLTWVLHRLHIKMNAYPGWRDCIIIETWPSRGDSLRAYRDYRILDEGGEELGVALSYWMMMNIETRRPQRMPKEVLELGLVEIPHTLPIKKDRFKPSSDISFTNTIEVRKSDLDMNMHVNNVAYIQWMLDTLPENTSKVREMDIQFLAESVADDVLKAGFTRTDKGYHHKLIKDEKPVAVALAITNNQ